MSCPYCNPEYQDSDRIVLKNEYWFANFDNHPVSKGHMKIIPFRHVAMFTELMDEELIPLVSIMNNSKKLIK